MVSARQDVPSLSERGLRRDAAEHPPVRPLDSPARPAEAPRIRADSEPRRSRHLISLGLHLGSLFAFAAAVPVLVLLVLDAAGVAGALPSPALDDGLLAVLVLIAAAGFGLAVGLLAAHGLAGALGGLTRAAGALGIEAGPAALLASEIREVARLAEAVGALRSRVVARAEPPDDLEAVGDLARTLPKDERLEVAARGSNVGLWDWDLTTDTLYCSPRWHQIAGVKGGGDVVSPAFWLDRVHPDDLAELRSAIDAHLRGHLDHLACEARLRGDDGVYRWTLCRGMALRREDGSPYRIAGSLTDTTDRRRSEELRLHEALHDGLTGLANRTFFLERLCTAIRLSRRLETHRVAVILMDVDRFKVVNDSLGHALGDALLIAVARRLEGCVRAVDTVARLGGDEWAILIEDVENGDEVSRVADRVRQELRQPLIVGGHSLFVTVSAGIALLTETTQAPEDLLRDAETAMYRAKELGRDRHVVFDPSLHGRAVALLELESDLRFALERGELVVYYQPIVTADGLDVRGVEALVRWRHPERGLVSPADFIGFAEESGLILPLGEWVLRRAIEQMREWQVAGLAPERISVNLSARQLQQENLAERVAHLLDRAGLDAGCLELELTEGVVAEQAETTIQVLKGLRDIGIQLAVDDFGTGYSSLAYLTRFPVSTVKIDRAFLVDIQHDSVNQAIVQAVTTLAHSIGMRVVAEGIETTEQLELARSLGCDEAQGYLISHPVSTDQATAWLDAHHGREPRRRVVPISEAR